MKKVTMLWIGSFVILLSIFIKFYLYSKPNLATFGYGYKRLDNKFSNSGDFKRFALLDHRGTFQDIHNIHGKTLLFIAHNTKCDFLLKKDFEIKSFFKNYKNLMIFFLNSDIKLHRESFEKISNFSILLDESQAISKNLNFKNVGDYILIDSDNWKKIESGNLRQLENSRKFKSCDLNLNPTTKISYVNDIAPILINKCLGCHSSENKIRPTFENYKKIIHWQEMILETLLTERMPPTAHDSYFGQYKNTDELSPHEKYLLITWFKKPLSDIKNVDPLENILKSEEKKQKRFKEIYSAKMDSPHKIPPGGEIIYQFFQLGGPTPHDMWIKSIKASSSNARQIHHESLMFTSKPLNFYVNFSNVKFPVNQHDIESNMDGTNFPYIYRAIETLERKNNDNYFRLNVFGAGKKRDGVLPKGAFGFVPKGSYLILEAHYMGTGVDDSEQTQVKIYGKLEQPEHYIKIKTAHVSSANLTIPANSSNVEIYSRKWVAKKDTSIISFSGHMHMRGKSIKMISVDQNNNQKTILSLPKYFYGWHTGVPIKPEEPIKIKKGDYLQVICNYDNSINNPYNPDPTKIVHYGQRLDRAEMCKIHFTYFEDKRI